MAIVSRFSAARAKSVKKAVKHSLTQRIRQSVGISDDSSSSTESEESEDETGSTGTKARQSTSDGPTDPDATLRGRPGLEGGEDGHSEGGSSERGTLKRRFRLRRKKDRKRRRGRDKKEKQGDIEMGDVNQDADNGKGGGFGLSSKEQITPADAVLAEESVNEVRFPLSAIIPAKELTRYAQFLQILDPAIMPLGIITLEDVLEGMCTLEYYFARC